MNSSWIFVASRQFTVALGSQACNDHNHSYIAVTSIIYTSQGICTWFMFVRVLLWLGNRYPVLWISPNSWVAYQTTHDGKLGCLNHFDLSLKINLFVFLVINTKVRCFLFNHISNYRELARPSCDFKSHVGSPNRVMGRIWRLGDCLSTALGTSWFNPYLSGLLHIDTRVPIQYKNVVLQV